MGILYLFCVAVLFSFGGTCAKLIGPYFDAEYITFFRFFMGVMFLLGLKAIKRQRFRGDFRSSLRSCGLWLVFGAVGKLLAYLTENYGLLRGVSYGGIIAQPAQTVFLTLISAFVLKEKISWLKAVFIVPCVAGVMVVSWNGRPLDEFVNGNLPLTLLFVVSGVFAGCHVLAQKMVAGRMDILDSNLTMFAIAAVLAVFPTLPSTFSGRLEGVSPDLGCLAGMLLFGFNTGIGFYLNAKAIPLVPFYMVPIVQSTMAIFAILWGVLFFGEPVTTYTVGGTLVFIAGIVGLQVSGGARKTEAPREA